MGQFQTTQKRSRWWNPFGSKNTTSDGIGISVQGGDDKEDKDKKYLR